MPLSPTEMSEKEHQLGKEMINELEETSIGLSFVS